MLKAARSPRLKRVLTISALLASNLVLEPPGTTRAQDDARYPPPVEGSLRKLIQKTVGAFSLKDARSFPDLLEEGATDALNLLYRSKNGVEIYHIISAFASSQAGEAYVESTVARLQTEGWKVLETGRIRQRNGEETGRLIVLGGPSSILLWTNRELVLLVTGPQEYVREFYEALPY